MIHARSEADEVEGLLRGHRVAANLGDKRDIFPGGEAGDQVVGLKHEADGVAAKLGELRFIGHGEIPTAIEQGAVCGGVESAELVEEGGFSAAGGAEEHDEFAGKQIEINAAERRDRSRALTVNARQPAHLKDRLAVAIFRGRRAGGGVGGSRHGEEATEKTDSIRVPQRTNRDAAASVSCALLDYHPP